MQPALEDLAVPAPIGADEEGTGPATLAMAAAALDEAEAARLVGRIEPTRSTVELAHWALGFGYHVHLYTSVREEVTETIRQAGLEIHGPADRPDVETALAARHPVIVSSPGDGPPFLLVLRQADDELVVDDPSVDERTLTWSWDRLTELLNTDPSPRVLELAPRSRLDR